MDNATQLTSCKKTKADFKSKLCQENILEGDSFIKYCMELTAFVTLDAGSVVWSDRKSSGSSGR